MKKDKALQWPAITIIDKWNNKTLRPAPHARENLIDEAIKNKDKELDALQGLRKAYIDALRTRGVYHTILIYDLENEPGQYYINDGMQRLYSILDYYNNFEKYGDTIQDRDRILKTSPVVLIKRTYKEHKDGVNEWTLANKHKFSI